MRKKNKLWENKYKSYFISNILNENAWLKKAKDLIDVAYSFEPEVNRVWGDLDLERRREGEEEVTPKRTGYFGTYFMLIAYAVENILKAKIISKKRSEFTKYIEQKWILPDDLKSHDLYELANDLNIPLNSHEESYLRRLSRSAVWAGRYPVPLKYDDLMPKRYSDGELHGESFFTRGETEEIKKLINKLLKSKRKRFFS